MTFYSTGPDGTHTRGDAVPGCVWRVNLSTAEVCPWGARHPEQALCPLAQGHCASLRSRVRRLRRRVVSRRSVNKRRGRRSGIGPRTFSAQRGCQVSPPSPGICKSVFRGLSEVAPLPTPPTPPVKARIGHSAAHLHASPYKPSCRHCSPLALREQHTSTRERDREPESASRVRIERHMEYLPQTVNAA